MIDINKLHVGMTRDEVIGVAGEPDDKGGTSRKYKTPSIFKYGNVQLFFEPYKDGKLVHGSLYDQDGIYKEKLDIAKR